MRRLSFHYGWVVVFGAMLGVFAAIGLGRFALGMLLPSMGEALGLSYAQMGFISTGNFIGYLVAVLLGGRLAGKFGPRRLIFFAVLLVGASLVLVSRATGYYQVLALYFATGVGSGAANVPLMALSATWFSRTRRGRASGFIVIGSGFGIILSGKLIPAVNQAVGSAGWRVNWLILGVTSLVIAVVCLMLIRNRPDELGLEPVGAGNVPPRTFDKVPAIYSNPTVYHLGAIYFLFGLTYVIYATFVVTALVTDHGFTEAGAGALYSWVGGLSLLSGPVFGTLSDRLGRKAAFVMVFTFQALAYFFVAPWLPTPFVYFSIVLFGLVAWSIPSIMAAAIGDYLGAARAAQAFGFVTFIFALGQIAGPAAAGMLAESSGSFTGSFYAASTLAFVAVVVSTLLKKPSAT